jgi:exodeoxyribonuclease VII small subunit
MDQVNQTPTATFAQSLNRLERIVDELNQPNLELERAMQLFKEGLQLSKQCGGQLEAFEHEMNALIYENQNQNQGNAA